MGCHARREGDEVVCARCNLRWDAVEEAPGCKSITQVVTERRAAPRFTARPLGRILATRDELQTLEPFIRRLGSATLVADLRDVLIEVYRLGRASK